MPSRSTVSSSASTLGSTGDNVDVKDETCVLRSLISARSRATSDTRTLSSSGIAARAFLGQVGDSQRKGGGVGVRVGEGASPLAMADKFGWLHGFRQNGDMILTKPKSQKFWLVTLSKAFFDHICLFCSFAHGQEQIHTVMVIATFLVTISYYYYYYYYFLM